MPPDRVQAHRWKRDHEANRDRPDSSSRAWRPRRVRHFFNHEWRERLPHRASASTELGIHSARSWLFAATFGGLAWLKWLGAWALVPPALIAAEYLITLADSLIEDHTRQLRPVERVNHMLLAMNTGLYAAFVTVQSARWWAEPTAIRPAQYPWLSVLITLCALATATWAVRDGLASLRLARGVRRGLPL